ncbi:hydroxyproline-2-epimerase [Roseiconus nitratireducens]|uniref:Hydroxyproline-2-epimerase n=1 Tax=Roseiconus nitratireducens TaxID=2605748 RepID=A0A5M6DLB1_9BACT|nr:proline racemase family protein [Roseiconus nitratireducens]KAA5547042.1 hydroxyproline-2-epimerase [Roseiconus nitratireducens]
MNASFHVLDTHTGGELTRVLLAPEIGLQPGSPREQLDQLRTRLDWVRVALTSEPRGTPFAVGAVVTPPVQSTETIGQSSTADGDSWNVIFFNNVGYLGMCGHGLIGVVEALRHQQRIDTGQHVFQTPAGRVTAQLEPDGQVTFTGVESYCYQHDVQVSLADGSQVTGDIAYGGNWFFLVAHPDVASDSIESLSRRCQQIRDAIDRDQIRGEDGAIIDHIELCGRLQPGESVGPHGQETAGCHSFVLCPGGHFDRSPCGTGTSAKLASLAARGKLEPGQTWIQQSVTGNRFLARYTPARRGVFVTLTGKAHVIAETRQIMDPDDPLRLGLGSRFDASVAPVPEAVESE